MRGVLFRIVMTLLPVVMLAGCAGDGRVHGSIYYGYGVGFYDPWYHDDVIVVPPPPPDRPGRPVRPVHPIEPPRPPVRPMPLPARPMPRPAPGGRLR